MTGKETSMRCKHARELMTKRLRESVSSEQEWRLTRHLGACARCAREQHELLSLEAVLRTLRAGSSPGSEAVRVDTASIIAGSRGSTARLGGGRALVAATAAGVAGATIIACAPLWSPTGVVSKPPRESPRRIPSRDQSTAASLQQHRTTLPALTVRIDEPSELPVLRSSGRVSAPPLRQETEPAQATELARPTRPVLRVREERPLDASSEAPFQLPGPENPNAVLPVAFLKPATRVRESGMIDRVLLAEPALKTQIIVRELDRPLGALLPDLGKRLKLELSAARSVADDKVTLVLEKRPAAEVLSLLGRHLGFRWRRTDRGYELGQDLAGRQREETLFRNELAPIEAQLNLASRMMQLSEDQLRTRIEALDARLKEEALPPDTAASLRAEKQLALDVMLSRGTVDASLAMFRALTPAQVDALLGGAEFRYSTANGTLNAARAEKVYATTSTLELLHGPLPRLQADVTVRFTDVEDQDLLPPPRRNRQLRLECQFNTVRGEANDPKYWGARWSPTLPELAAASPKPSAPPSDPDLARPVQLTLPGPTRQPGPVTGGSIIGAAVLGHVWPRQTTLAEISLAIHQSTGLEVVADSFASARLDPSLLRTRQPLRQVLDIVAGELDYTWEMQGRLLLFRNRRYYRDRPAEVPLRVVAEFRSQVLRERRLTLETVGTLAARLTDPQARGMYRYWGWYLEDSGILPVESFFPRRAHFRFWNSLAPAQRAAARTDGGLPVAQLTPAQRELWLAALLAPPVSSRTPSGSAGVPTPEQVAAGRFRVRQYEAQMVSFINPVDEGKRHVGTTLVVEGPRDRNPLDLAHTPDGRVPEGAGPQISLDGYRFAYYVGGSNSPATRDEILLPPLRSSIKTPRARD